MNDGYVVSIIIPTFGRPSIMQCKEALERQTRRPDEIIIVEDKKRNGAGWGRNEGIRKAKGNLIGFMDDDCIADEQWLAQMIKALDEFKADIAGGLYTETDPYMKFLSSRRVCDTQIMIDNKGLVGTGGNLVCRREVLDRLKERDGFVFDEQMKFGGEDWELVQRLRRDNAVFVYVPNHPVHLKTLNLINFCRFMFFRGRGIADLYLLFRNARTDLSFHKSMLWEEKGGKKKINWLKILIHRVLGPFNKGDFDTWKHFAMFWVGEKIKAMGFVWQMLLIKTRK